MTILMSNFNLQALPHLYNERNNNDRALIAIERKKSLADSVHVVSIECVDFLFLKMFAFNESFLVLI